MNFKEQVILARARLNVSQETLARLLNVSFATVNRWETGKNEPSKKAKVSFIEFCKKNNALNSKELR